MVKAIVKTVSLCLLLFACLSLQFSSLVSANSNTTDLQPVSKPQTASPQTNTHQSSTPQRELFLVQKNDQNLSPNYPITIKSKNTEYSSFAELNVATAQLASQIEDNANFKYKSNPVIITSFLNLDNMKETSGLGRIIAENLMYELQTRKWNIIDIRLGKDIHINESGEFSLSRDVKKIKETYSIGTIITGTYTVANDCIVVNARAIDINTAMVVSSGQIMLPIAGIEYLLTNISSIKPIQIRGDDLKEPTLSKSMPLKDPTNVEIKKIVEEEVKKRIEEDVHKKLNAEIAWKVNEEIVKAMEAEKAKAPVVKRKILKPVEK